MKKVVIWILVLVSILALIVRFFPKGAEILLGTKQRSGLSVLSKPEGVTVFLDGVEAGKTPFEDKNLEVREYTVKLDKDGSIWQGKMKLSNGTVSVVNRDLTKDTPSQSGEVLTLEKGQGLTVISNPSESEVEIDGKVLGKTPVTLNVEAGEHTILVSHPNYFKRSIRANLPTGFNLTISVDLGISEADLTAVVTPTIKITEEVEVLDTPTGFLRVRDKASLNGKELTRVKPGDSLILLEELGDWVRVRLSDNTEGYVSSTYVEKKKP